MAEWFHFCAHERVRCCDSISVQRECDKQGVWNSVHILPLLKTRRL
jgi:hypothetical protein